MSNKIQEFFRSMSDKELQKLIAEIKDSESTGIIPSDSLFRKKVKDLADMTDGNFAANILGATVGILKEYAFRKEGFFLEMNPLERALEHGEHELDMYLSEVSTKDFMVHIQALKNKK